MEKIEKNLEYLGILGKEAKIYIALLKMKHATIIQLVKTTNIKRTTIYHSIESLIDKGLVGTVIKNDKKFYIAEDPSISMNNILQEKKKVIDFIVPELKDIFGKGAYQPEIKIYRNISGMKKIFEDVLSSEEKIGRYYISNFDLEDLLGEDFLNDFVKRRVKAGIKSLSLRSFKYKPEREIGINHHKLLREVKFMPEDMGIKPYMCIYGNKVVVISAKEEKMGFIIESKEFAEAQKIIFDAIWEKIAM